MPLIDSICTIKHLNVRKEGPDEAKVMALDIKLSDAETNPAFLARILGAEYADVKASFWDSEGEARFSGIETMTSWCAIDNCTVTMGGLVLKECQIHKFKFKPRGDFIVEIEFQVSLKEPPENALPIIGEHVQDGLSVTVDEVQADMFSEAANG